MRSNNMKKFFAALAALVGLGLSATAEEVGDIYSIDPVVGSGSATSALVAGQSFQFRMRLLARDFENPAAPAWRIVHTGIGSEELDAKASPPAIGVMVGGELKKAVYCGTSTGYTTEEGGHPYTDFFFEYVVQPGDLALPAKLALASSDPATGRVDVPGALDVPEVAYYFWNSDLWSIVTTNETETFQANFFHCSAASAILAVDLWGAAVMGVQSEDWDLSKASFFVKAIDFDPDRNHQKDGYWRTVPQGSAQASFTPTVEMTAAPERSTTLYVWSEDPSVVELTDKYAVEMDMKQKDGTVARVKVCKIVTETGVTSYPFEIKGGAAGAGKSTNLVLSPRLGYAFDAAGVLLEDYLTARVYCDEPLPPTVQFSFEPEGLKRVLWADTITNSLEFIEAADAVPVFVTLTEPYTEPVTVQVAVRLEADKTADVIGDGTIAVEKSTDFSPTEVAYTNITFDAGQMRQTFYVYPLNGTAQTAANGVSFTPVIADETAAAFYKDYISATLFINENPRPKKQVFVELYDTTSQPEANTRTDYNEGESPMVRFVLTEQVPSGKKLYAFLQPLNEASSNLVESNTFTMGVELPAGQFSSGITIDNALALLDGCAATEKGPLEFSVVIRTAPKIDEGTLDTTFSSVKKLTINCRNVAPKTDGIFVEGDPMPIEDGETRKAAVAATVPQSFVASMTDPSFLDVSNGLMAVWCFSDGRTGSQYKYSITTAATETVTCKHTFTYPGATQTVQVVAIDKDILASLAPAGVENDQQVKELWPMLIKIAKPYQIHVFVADAPHVTVLPDKLTLNEGVSEGKLVIELSEPAEQPLTLKVIAETMDETGRPGKLVFASETVTIAADQTEPARSSYYQEGLKFKYAELDGTPGSMDSGWFVTVQVETDAEKGKDYFAKAETYVYVNNLPPKVTPAQASEDFTNRSAAVGAPYQIEWSASDVAEDLAAGLTARWYIDDVEQTDLRETVTSGATRTTGVTFRQDGLHTVRLEVTDKDGVDYNGQTSRTWLFYINPTKRLLIEPYGCWGQSETVYNNKAGVGKGRVWADGLKATVEGFRQAWTYGIDDADADVYAFGYPSAAAPYVDDGSLGPLAGKDVAITRDGNGPATDDYFEYDGEYDNYFYCWVNWKFQDGGGTEIKYGKPSPAKTPNAVSPKTIPLDQPKSQGDGEHQTCLPTQIEAIFAREFYKQDNLGDINADGIPDLYVSTYWPSLMTDDGSGADLQKLNLDNADGDYLPNTETAEYASFIPDLADSWVMAGRAFTAKLEIRGFGEHFNDAYALDLTTKKLGIKADRRYADPDEDGDSTLTKLEWLSFCDWCAANGGLDPTVEDNWKLWSPERPTDPTLADTDGDGMPDGYEYYVWYKAHVGSLVGTNVVRLTGRRYVPANPGLPTLISSEEIARLYDPLTPNNELSEIDTDNDGLPDLVEFELGTNPFDFDTDHDGLPDGYEVAISHTDPKDPTSFDGSKNPDKDSMAYLRVEMTVIALGEGGVTNRLVCAKDAEIEETVDEADPSVTNRVLKSVTGAFDAWIYGTSGLPCRGRALNADSVTNQPVVSVAKAEVLVLHFLVACDKGFDPRCAWNRSPIFVGHMVDTAPFTSEDEFLLMAFYYHCGGLTLDEITPTKNRPLTEIWAAYTTDPNSADTDEDGMPDGWEAYVQARFDPAAEASYGAPACGPDCAFGPIQTFENIRGTTAEDADLDGIDWPHEFSGVESAHLYEHCPTITLLSPEWKNKWWPTDPWNGDTDGDGMLDGEEGMAFIYGDNEHTKSNFEDTVAGGGLNPLSWDTDRDGLPDPWEAEFPGSFGAGETVKSSETTYQENDDGTITTNVVDTSTTTAGQWNNDGMDGTVNDAHRDYDHDGLENWQEYMVGAMRCWRWDDTKSNWQVHKATREEVDAYTGEDWYEVLVNMEGIRFNPGLRNQIFDPGVYFSCENNAFELSADVAGKFYMFKDGIYHDLKFLDANKQNRWTRGTFFSGLMPLHYVSCDPRNPDSDMDGMDDYYELFHGLNPLLGQPRSDDGDVVFRAWGGVEHGAWGGDANHWYPMGAMDPAFSPRPDVPVRLKGVTESLYDFFQFPWLAGMPDVDPDGDNIRNQQEAIFSNVQAASTYLHTDPTPLWMTEKGHPESLTYRYYQYASPSWVTQITQWKGNGPTFTYTDPETEAEIEYAWDDFPWLEYDAEHDIVRNRYEINGFGSLDYLYSFEENEGFDSDHDYLSDFEEGQGKTKSASDPQNHDSPIRRQAMWFGGEDEKGFLQTPLAIEEVPENYGGGSEPRQNFLYYTVECWAKPDADTVGRDGLQTLVERAVWNAPSNPADENYLRKNFLIGINNGRWYTKFDSTGTDANQPVEITDGPAATTNWTHIAATYDGVALKLYVNGVDVKTKPTSIQPEHGVDAIFVDEIGDLEGDAHLVTGVDKRKARLVSILVGASAADKNGIAMDMAWLERFEAFVTEDNPYGLAEDFATTIEDYDSFYRGYVDEVRIWDGARTKSDILADYQNRTRYSAQLAIDNRQKVFEAWSKGASRAPVSELPLPAQLMYHWAFDHVAGAIDAKDVAQVPAGFDTDEVITDAKAKWSRPDGWKSAWWSSIDDSIRSSVYTDTAWVPWINNTVGHLPRYDLMTLDSFYWSEDFAGALPATAAGYKKFAFPRSAEVPSAWIQHQYDGVDPLLSAGDRMGVVAGNPALALAYVFARRDRETVGFDLLPMGGAYPRRISSAEGGMWDDQGASDAWAQNGEDANNNGLPDAWEEYARNNYNPETDPETGAVEWGSTVEYDGKLMPASEAYLRDLAKGLVCIDGEWVIKPEYADTRDVDRDGIPDWWEDLYGIDTHSVADRKADPDCDGLSNYQEYLISELDGIFYLDPTKAHSYLGQLESDYYLQVEMDVDGQIRPAYLGEIYADHDFLEDNSEDVIGTDRTLYDAWSDYDEDGWSAWSELRYSNFKMTRAARLISHIVGEEEVVDAPVPVIHTTLRYNGELATNGTYHVEAYAGDNLQAKPAATYTLTAGEEQTRYIYLGPWEDRVVHGTLTPGHLVAGADQIALQSAFIQPKDNFSWEVIDAEGNVSMPMTGNWEEMWKAWNANLGSVTVNSENFEWSYRINGMETDGRNVLQLEIDAETQKGYILLFGERVGNIDLISGDFDFDLAPLSKYMTIGTAVQGTQKFYRIEYKTRIPTMQTKKLAVSLATPDTGRFTEGKYTFVAWMDKDGDGVFTPGVDPSGFAKSVEIGWDNVPSVEIEMVDSTESSFVYGDDVEQIRIIRTAINGSDEGMQRRVVFTRNAKKVGRKEVLDVDYIQTAKYGLDWNYLASDIDAMEGLSEKDVTEVEYTVVKGVGPIVAIPEESVLKRFTVNYQPQRATPVCASPSPSSMGIVETARPTFRWTVAEGYTVFRLQIQSADGSWTYNSGAQFMPARDANGAYVWTAPVYVGTNVCGDAWSMMNNGDYKWRVSVYNPKFSDISGNGSGWSDWCAFRTAASGTNDGRTNYGTAEVTVKYFGGATNELKDVIVQLYKTADFTGTPVSQTRLSTVEGDVTELANGSKVTFVGLESGNYYAAAFIDRNGDATRQRYETWGYAAQVDLGIEEIWMPFTVKVDAGASEAAKATVYMEDTDVNQNDVFDPFDDESILKSATATGTDVDAATDTDGDGMPDEWETENGLDPYDPSDAANAIDGDVMAYRDIEVCLVKVGVLGGDSTWYALLDLNAEPAKVVDGLIHKQTPASNLVNVASTWDNGTFTGIGTNVTFAAEDGLVVLDAKMATARLIHAQVYAWAGFNPKTAVNVKDAVDTKPFTALDKYLVGKYFATLGISEWKDLHLDPNLIDADEDGLPDGWENYVMFGKDRESILIGANAGEGRISPFVGKDGQELAPGADSKLKLYEEYDNGFATDPWQLDTNGDGIGDADTYAYGLKGDGCYRRDQDNDQLSNFAEFLISKLDGFPTLNAQAMSTFGQNVPDYFLPHGRLYLGEMFTDHDFIEDWWEDEQSVEVKKGSEIYENYSRYVYDAHKDSDNDGWNNWSEARAKIAAGLVTVVSYETNTVAGVTTVTTNVAEVSAYDYFGGRPKPTVSACIRYNGALGNLGGKTLVVKAWSQENVNDETMSGVPDAVWTFTCDATHALAQDIVLAEDEHLVSGYLREGRSAFVAYVVGEDESGDDKAKGSTKQEDDANAVPDYVVGQPYGVRTGVEVGYLHGEPFALEMLDVSPSMLRINLKEALTIQSGYTPSGLDGSDDGIDYNAEQRKALFDEIAHNWTDRGKFLVDYAGLDSPIFVGTNMADVTTFVRVRILKDNNLVIERKFNPTEHPILTELDFFADGALDFDWGRASGNSMTYRIVVLEGSTDRFDFNNNLAVVFVNKFESSLTKATNLVSTVQAGRPTFSWEHPNTIGKPYPAFCVSLSDAEGNVVYESGPMAAPARDEKGFYHWTAPIGVGSVTDKGIDIKSGETYTWSVSMLDAKFTKPVYASAPIRFPDSLADSVGSDYGQIAVAVKYFGPGKVRTSGEYMIRVEAFETPDFVGTPVSSTRVCHLMDENEVNSLNATNRVEINAILRGLPKGGQYYVRAYLDTDGSGKRDVWESWGYGNFVGTDRKDVYTPRAYAIAPKTQDDLMTPDAVVYVEDCDTNNNKIPDVWEMEQDGVLGGPSTEGVAVQSPYVVTLDGGKAEGQLLFAKIEPGMLSLPYYSALIDMANGKSISSLSLALAMSGIDLESVETKPVVTITSFSLTDGVKIKVDARATVDGEKLVPQVVQLSVNLRLVLKHADTPMGPWEPVEGGEVSATFDITSESTELPQDKLDQLNEAIKAKVSGASGFFQVEVIQE